jgi:hypothetical protein
MKQETSGTHNTGGSKTIHNTGGSQTIHNTGGTQIYKIHNTEGSKKIQNTQHRKQRGATRTPPKNRE